MRNHFIFIIHLVYSNCASYSFCIASSLKQDISNFPQLGNTLRNILRNIYKVSFVHTDRLLWNFVRLNLLTVWIENLLEYKRLLYFALYTRGVKKGFFYCLRVLIFLQLCVYTFGCPPSALPVKPVLLIILCKREPRTVSQLATPGQRQCRSNYS